MEPFKIPDLRNITLPHIPPLAVKIAQEQGDLTRHLLSGDALFEAMFKAVQDLAGRAPADHDVLIHALGINVLKAGFIQPHAIWFSGYDDNGHEASVIAHFSQVVARVIYLPKKGPDRVLTGFWKSPQ